MHHEKKGQTGEGKKDQLEYQNEVCGQYKRQDKASTMVNQIMSLILFTDSEISSPVLISLYFTSLQLFSFRWSILLPSHGFSCCSTGSCDMAVIASFLLALTGLLGLGYFASYRPFPRQRGPKLAIDTQVRQCRAVISGRSHDDQPNSLAQRIQIHCEL